jgi:hypothetical protein
MEGSDTEPGGCLDIFDSIVDEERSAWLHAHTGQAHLKDRRIRFRKTDLARDDHDVEPLFQGAIGSDP